MKYTFNLITQPWIPVLDLKNKSEVLSLSDVLFQAHQLRNIALSSPLEAAAVYRLILAVLHSALRGPESSSAWMAIWKAGTLKFPWLYDYLEKWMDHFDLFHPERPFYQSRNEHSRTKSIINVVMDMASGNTAALFDHHTEEAGATLDIPQAARLLITVQSFGLAGLFDPQKKITFTDAPWARGIIFMLESDNLFKTIGLNLLRYDNKNARPIPGGPKDHPAWEMDDPHTPDRQIPDGYLDLLTWQNRRLYLHPELDNSGELIVRDIDYAPGLRLSNELLDPMKHYRLNEQKGYLVLRFNEGRALWRDSAALLQFGNPKGNRPPMVFEETARRFPFDNSHRLFRFMAMGMANDQAKIEFFRFEGFPLPAKYLVSEELVSRLSDALQSAEVTRNKLSSACQWLSLLLLYPKSDGERWEKISRQSREEAAKLASHWGFDRAFWGSLELSFLRLMEDLPNDPDRASEDWRSVLQKTAWSALEHAANLAGNSPAALKASVRARSMLAGTLKELFPDRIETEVVI